MQPTYFYRKCFLTKFQLIFGHVAYFKNHIFCIKSKKKKSPKHLKSLGRADKVVTHFVLK